MKYSNSKNSYESGTQMYIYIYVYIYLDLQRGAHLNPMEGWKKHPLGTIWHPCEGAGK